MPYPHPAIRGAICAIATPFDASGALDLGAFARLLDYQIDNGTQALVVAGSTGEAHGLEDAEYDRLLAFAVSHVAHRVPVIAGTGQASTSATLATTRQAVRQGVDVVLVVTPYYLRPTQEGLRRHFLEVAEHASVPVILYNVPTRTGCDLLPDTVAGLRGHPGIIGIKEAVATSERIAALAELAQSGFVYLSGDDDSAVEAMLAGAAGTISVVANLVPRQFRALCDAALAGERAMANDLLVKIKPVLEALACAPNPIPVKAGLAELGLCEAGLRAPLHELDTGVQRRHLKDALEQVLKLSLAV